MARVGGPSRDVLIRWAGFSARHPLWVVLLVVVLSGGLVYGFSQARAAEIQDLFLPGSRPEVQALDRMGAAFGSPSFEFFLVELEGPLDGARAGRVLDLERDLAGTAYVLGVDGLGDLLLGPDGSRPADLESALQEARASRSDAFGRVVSEPWVLVRVRVDPDVSAASVVDALARAVRAHEAGFASLRATGPLHAQVDQAGRGVADLQYLFPLAMLFVFLVLFTGTGSARVALLAIAIEVWAVVLAFATLPWLGVPFSPLLYSIGLLILGLGIDYQLHLLYAFLGQEPGSQKWERWQAAMRRTGRPVFYTVTTTVIGFGSFLASPIPQVQHWGLLILLGAAYSFLLGVTLLPAWVGVSGRRGPLRPPRWVEATTRAAGRGVWGGRFVVLGLVLVGTLGLAWAATGITVSQGIGDLPEESGPLYEALDRIESSFGGQEVVFVVVDAAVEPVWVELDALAQRLQGLEGVGFVDAETERARRASGGALPAPSRSGAESGPVLSVGNVTRVFVFVEPENASAVAERVEEAVAASGLPAVATGRPVLDNLGPRLVLEGLFRSTGVAFGLVFLVLALVFRRVRPTLAALTPLLVVLVWQFGSMRGLGLELNAVTGVTTAMIIGIGVDYALHLVADVERGLARGGSRREAVSGSVGHVGMAVFTGTVTTVGVFLILSVSQQSQVRQFGTVSALVVGLAFVVALAVLPLYYVRRPLRGPFEAWVNEDLRCPACGAVQAVARDAAPSDWVACRSCGVLSERQADARAAYRRW